MKIGTMPRKCAPLRGPMSAEVIADFESRIYDCKASRLKVGEAILKAESQDDLPEVPYQDG